jgi:DNA mismatch endonuclease (patch repair protein)
MDKLSPERRSANMRAIRSKGMKPELIVRKLVHSLGYRYRLHRKELPGKPDLAFVGRKKAIFVHGCFWHQHENCREGRPPKSNVGYWGPKLARNVERDAENAQKLSDMGWQVLTVWECETKRPSELIERLSAFLSNPS